MIISSATVLWAFAALLYIVLAGWLLLALLAKQTDRRIAQPLLTMVKIAGLSGIVFMLASVPSYVAQMVNPEISAVLLCRMQPCCLL